MKEGEVLESGSLSDILDHPKHPYTRILLSSAG
jgi:microcin C transport system ATP-binding protein